MKDRKRPKLPRGLRWHSESQYIWFVWYDAKGKQHKKSTETTDPAKALLFKLRFLKEHGEKSQEAETADLSNQSLERVTQLYFDWKVANNSPETVKRERRIFKKVLDFLGQKRAVRTIRLANIREYQKKRRQEVSPTMKKPVGARTINYEMQLLRGVMQYADCWTGNLEARYQPLRQIKSRIGKIASKEQLMKIISMALSNEYWRLAMWCGAVAAGSGCRGGEIRKLRLEDIDVSGGSVRIVKEISKNRKERAPRLMALAEWGLRQLLERARALGAVEPEHYLLPLSVSKSRHLSKTSKEKWDVTRPMVSWVRSWRKLTEACGMKGFRFHDLRHTFRTQGAEAGVPLEVMMVQLGHMDRETSLDYVHIQQRALDRAKQLIEIEQAEILATAEAGQMELQSVSR
ncbi:MAG: tyrosine-type recombinase/integrase [Candidatus Angelobacter sp.]